jgi:hypothetical protein
LDTEISDTEISDMHAETAVLWIVREVPPGPVKTAGARGFRPAGCVTPIENVAMAKNVKTAGAGGVKPTEDIVGGGRG